MARTTTLMRHKLKIEIEGQENLVAVAAAELGKNHYTSTQEKLALFLLGRNFTKTTDGETG
nr:hypothetical protein [uncultured Rhodoferax sp.]